MKEIVCAGFGGQGVLTAGLIISDIAVRNGHNATWMPSYGSAMRGGTANCTVKYGEDFVYNPSQEKPNVVLAMNQLSFNRFSAIMASGGVIFASEMVEDTSLDRDDLTVINIPCHKMADEIGHSKGANIVMTGAILKVMGDYSLEQGLESMEQMFSKKGKSKFGELNAKAMRAGYDFV